MNTERITENFPNTFEKFEIFFNTVGSEYEFNETLNSIMVSTNNRVDVSVDDYTLIPIRSLYDFFLDLGIKFKVNTDYKDSSGNTIKIDIILNNISYSPILGKDLIKMEHKAFYRMFNLCELSIY